MTRAPVAKPGDVLLGGVVRAVDKAQVLAASAFHGRLGEAPPTPEDEVERLDHHAPAVAMQNPAPAPPQPRPNTPPTRPPRQPRPPAVVSRGAGGQKTVHVNGYFKKDGQYVPGYVRAAPGMGGGRRR